MVEASATWLAASTYTSAVTSVDSNHLVSRTSEDIDRTKVSSAPEGIRRFSILVKPGRHSVKKNLTGFMMVRRSFPISPPSWNSERKPQGNVTPTNFCFLN
jgi:hypothetical protein